MAEDIKTKKLKVKYIIKQALYEGNYRYEELIPCSTDMELTSTRESSVSGALSEVRLFGYGIFDFYDVISSAFGLTIGAVLMLLFVLFKWRFENFRREANLGAGRRIYIWVPMSTYYKFILPLL